MTASSGRLREFAVGVLAEAGALVERLEPEGLEALLPAPVQQALQTPDWLRLGFATELPPEAQRVSLESDWLTRLGGLLGERLRLQLRDSTRRIINITKCDSTSGTGGRARGDDFTVTNTAILLLEGNRTS